MKSGVTLLAIQALSVQLATTVVSNPTLAVEAICADPPGPPGTVSCGDGQIAICKADGNDTQGYCLNPPESGAYRATASSNNPLLSALGLTQSDIVAITLNNETGRGRIVGEDFVVTFKLPD